MDLKDLLDYCKAEAISNTLLGTEVAVWREICRNYSERFATPLHLCLDGTIPPEDIILAHFESQLDEFDPDRDLDGLLDQLYILQDPDYEREKRREVDDFIDQACRDEAERIRLGKPIHKALKKEVSLKNTSENPIPSNLPKSGGVNFSYLNQDKEG